VSLVEKAVERLAQLNQVREVGSPEEPKEAPKAAGGPAGHLSNRRLVTEDVQPDVSNGAAPRASEQVEIDLGRLALRGMVTPNDSKSRIAEEYRLIKRPLLSNVQGRGADAVADANLIMITSALPGEGKSFNAVNMALSIAMELDHTVLLVDADVSKPSILATLGLPPRQGLMDVLTGAVDDVSGVLLKTNIENLSLLPAGTPHARATELLASDSMTRLLDEMSDRYSDRIIVFDSPPLLVTTEARVLATHMGQIVVVVEANRTTYAMIQQALSAVAACPVKLLLLNKSSESGPGGYYGYGYGYGSTATPDAA
jgi:receptor protein-tyrosine kinase